MKTFTLLLLLTMASFLVSAQNWKLINTSEKFNFQCDTAAVASHTLWVDSVEVVNGDSIWFLNRTIVHCDTCSNSIFYST